MNASLVLGTAQFGLDYGINNKRGRVPSREVFDILFYAVQHGVNTLDTAIVYEDSENLIGKFLKTSQLQLKVISKLPSENIKVNENFKQSLDRLGLKEIYGYLIHNFRSFIDKPAVWDELRGLKDKGLVEKIGFSLYHPQELEQLWQKRVEVDILQVPLSILDQRFAEYLPEIKQRKIELYVRSVFLQGLIFKQPGELEERFKSVRHKIEILRALSDEHDIPLEAIAINFVLLNPLIDYVIIGVNSLDDLKENIRALQYQSLVKKIFSQLAALKEDDEAVIVPTNWTK